MSKNDFWGAFQACKGIGGDLPRNKSLQDKSNFSYSLKQCSGNDNQSPQFIQRENFGIYHSSYCHMAKVSCYDWTGHMVVTKATGFGRLLSDNDDVVAAHVPNEGYITAENFTVTSSRTVQTERWDNGEAIKGY